MTEHKESALAKSIRQNMQLKDSDELLSIWVKNDRLEWSDEAFSIVHDILLERLGDVPTQSSGKAKRTRKKRAKERTKTPLSILLIFLPAIFLILLVWLIPVINPNPFDQRFTVLFLVSTALMFLVPGIYFAWKGWGQSEVTKKEISVNLSNMKENAGIFFRFYTYFLPDRHVPAYFLFAMRSTSIAFLLGGLIMILFLIEML